MRSFPLTTEIAASFHRDFRKLFKDKNNERSKVGRKWIEPEVRLVRAFAYMVRFGGISVYSAVNTVMCYYLPYRSWESIRSRLNRERNELFDLDK